MNVTHLRRDKDWVWIRLEMWKGRRRMRPCFVSAPCFGSSRIGVAARPSRWTDRAVHFGTDDTALSGLPCRTRNDSGMWSMGDGSARKICFLCEKPFAFGPHTYEGRYVRPLGVHICDGCLLPNEDGLALDYEAKLLAHLSERGLPLPLRNSNGLLILR
jgi:hypothetical protein